MFIYLRRYYPQKHVTQPYLINFEFNQFEIQKRDWIKFLIYLSMVVLHIFEGNVSLCSFSNGLILGRR